MRKALVFGMALLSSEVWAADLMKTDTGHFVHWAPGTVTVGVDPAFVSRHVSAEEIAQAIDEAAAAWNALTEMRVTFVRAPVPEAAVKVRFCQGRWERPAGLLGHTLFQAETGSGLVAEAVVEVNECDYRFVGPDRVAPDHLDLQAVLTHELGHVLGLGHSVDPDAVMFSSTGTVRQRRPGLDDRLGVATIYTTSPPANQTHDSSKHPLELPTPHLTSRPTDAEPEHPPPRLYTGGKERPVAFELPWPESPGGQGARFVPTVLPVAPRPDPAFPPPSKAVRPNVVRKKTASPPPGPGVRPSGTPGQPVGTELAWPAPAQP